MTIEENIREDSTKFEELLDSKTPDFKEALVDLSEKLDKIISSMILEYCDSEGVEMKIEDAREYKTMNRLITAKLDSVIGEHIKDKRKAL